MITEERRITLSRNALLRALQHCRKELELGIPPGTITDVRPTPEGGCWLHIQTGGSIERFELSPAQMAAVVIAYARHLRIPLPKRGQKSLAGDDDAISMVILVTNRVST